MKKLLVMMLLLYPLSASASTYEWTDGRGTVNFTEDLGKVPKKYRKKVRVLGGEDGAPQTTVITEPATVKEKGEDPQKGKQLYGGKDERTWRNDFLAARSNLQQAESDLADLRGRLGDTSKMSRSEYLSIQLSLKHGESRQQQLQKKLKLLQESADRVGVPDGFRQ